MTKRTPKWIENQSRKDKLTDRIVILLEIERAKRDLSRNQFSVILGVSGAHLTLIKQGKRTVGIGHLVQWAKKFKWERTTN